jgi:hypothetical protein
MNNNTFVSPYAKTYNGFTIPCSINKIERQVTQEQINEIFRSVVTKNRGREIGRDPYVSGFPNIFKVSNHSKTIKYTVEYPSKNIVVEELIKIFHEDECFYRWDGEEYNEPHEFIAEWSQIELIVFTDTATTLKLVEESIKRKWLSISSQSHPDYDSNYAPEYDDESPSLWFDNQIGQYCLDDIPLCNISE